MSRPPTTSSSLSAPAGGTDAATGTGAAAGGSGTTASPRPSPAGETERDADERAIVLALGAYAQGYTALDAAAVRRVWPTVNEEALRNAFEQLEAQRVSFASCTVDVRGLHASASCRGNATYVPKVGSRESISGVHAWHFALRKVVDAWVIESATIR